MSGHKPWDQIKAIQTEYNGIRFRSRVEARWAVFFDALSISWDYEVEGFVDSRTGNSYLPDFKISLPSSCVMSASGVAKTTHYESIWFEVKGAEPTAEEIAKARMLAIGTKTPVLIAFGSFSSGYKTSSAPVMVRLTELGELEGLLCFVQCPVCDAIGVQDFRSSTYMSSMVHDAYSAARRERFGVHDA